MLKAPYIGMNPKISVEKDKHIIRGCFIEIVIGDVEYSLDEKDAKYLHSVLDETLYDETAQELANRLDDANATIDGLKEKIEELNNLIEVLEGRT
jgi:predicted RNase H-like nuclease (RuvC/YqgF family)